MEDPVVDAVELGVADKVVVAELVPVEVSDELALLDTVLEAVMDIVLEAELETVVAAEPV